jgi:HEAT repeat protein
MRSIITSVGVLFALLAVAGPLPAQAKADAKTSDVETPDEIDGKTLAQWIKQIKDRDPALAEVAIRTVVFFGDKARKEATPALIDALSFTDTSLRVNACITLTMLGIPDSDMKRAVSALTRLVSDPQSIVRFYAATALGRLGDDARPAIPELVFRCKDAASWEIRRAAAYALGKAGQATRSDPLDMRAAHALIGLCTGFNADPCAEVRLTAVMALGGMGIPALPNDKMTILQAFNAALKDKYKAVVIWAHMGLIADGEAADKDKHLAAISKFLGSQNDYESRLQATRALGVMGKEAKSEMRELMRELDKPREEPLLVAAAAWALGQIGPAADDALPRMQEIVDQKGVQDTVKTAVKDAMDKIDSKPKKK